MPETLTAPAVAGASTLPSDLMTTREAAMKLRVSKGAVYGWMNTGLRHYRLGRAIRVRESDVAEFLERRRSKPPLRPPRYDRRDTQRS
jgi:excisionase family DNA binding protein